MFLNLPPRVLLTSCTSWLGSSGLVDDLTLDLIQQEPVNALTNVFLNRRPPVFCRARLGCYFQCHRLQPRSIELLSVDMDFFSKLQPFRLELNCFDKIFPASF